ncbi:MAG: aspartate kinase [Bacteroidota bacterium]|nr:aspartate kinase [Bacteroidota bacterium]MDX5430714.1 aspartate kinase [Bacteroidota bacterium]MDX5469461.1 aspartate kinase [Bacteroidota bacterium]
MRVFKFGGASVKDAEAVKNVASVLRRFEQDSLLIVVSAMGKTTNALERLVKAYVDHDKAAMSSIYTEVKSFHDTIIAGLLKHKDSHAYDDIENLFIELECLLETQAEGSYDYNYDQIVSYGEIFSSRILSTYLKEADINNRWIDARNFIQTDNRYREGKVDWNLTTGIISRKLKPIVQKQKVVTQGFIGQTPDKQTITLGREGSDYSAAIFAYGLDAESVTIWKDVAGVMNADPKRMPDAVKIDGLNYKVAIELAYYGATVIHPKTIQPLQSKGIPLFVKSFMNPEAPGTEVSTSVVEENETPFYIFKDHQAFISLSSSDFSFIAEEHLTHIFSLLSQFNVRANVMQNSAISFSLVVNDDPRKVDPLLEALSQDYLVQAERDAQLITIRNYNHADIAQIIGDRKVWL